MKLHRLVAHRLYKRLDALKEENELLKMSRAQACGDESYNPQALRGLKRLFERSHAPLEAKSLNEVLGGLDEDRDCRDLAALFTKHGSDKATTHNYYLIYAHLLRGKRQQPLQILEIGLGTNNTDVPSNMGPTGKPGASLRAFSEWAPQATVIGADVDERILFNEGRISTFYVDQTKPETIEVLARTFAPKSFDLVIDDGLHTPEANVNFLNVALDLVKDSGTIVIEDVAPRHLLFWTAVSWALTEYRVDFMQTRACSAVLVRKK